MENSVLWIMKNLGFTFLFGFFYGILIVDVFYSIHILAKIKKFAQTHKIIVRYENLKTNIAKYNEELAEKANFFFFFKAEPHELAESIKKYIEKEREFLKDMIKWKGQKKRVAKGGEKSDSLVHNIVMVILAKLWYNVNKKSCI